jgi:formate dehydrogenase major subunit
VAVIGGGNTAMDACRTALRLGADVVYNIYRRTRDEMPAQNIEITEAEEEGVVFKYLVNPIEIVGEGGKVAALDLQIMELGEADEQGRRRPVPIKGAKEVLQVDKVIVAIGQWAALGGLEALAANRGGNVAVDNNFATNIRGVFAIGDAADKGAGIAVEAIADAQKAAVAVDAFLVGEGIAGQARNGGFLAKQENLTSEDFAHISKVPRLKIPHRESDVRRNDFAPVNLPLAEETIKKEAARCLECGCAAYSDCQLLRYANEYDANPQKLSALNSPPSTRDDSHENIRLDQAKCILCGLCMRACEKLAGVTALGLVGRGHGTAVSPALLAPLAETDCNACTICAQLCPTGAIIEKHPSEKRVLLSELRIED